jgi:hypothetical protein
MRSMEALRWLSVVALGIWIGGLLTLGIVVAPTVFAVAGSQGPGGGNELAGRMFGAMLDAFQLVAWVCAGLLLVSLAARAAIGPRPRRTALRTWTVVAMLAASVAVKFVVGPEIDSIRETTRGAIAALSPDDPVRIRFGRLHAASTGLMCLTVLAGLCLVWSETRDRH